MLIGHNPRKSWMGKNLEGNKFTFALFTYNQEMFVEQALISALSQTYSPLEIIVSDDCSTDKTWDIIAKVVTGYRGPHKVIARRNEKNLGIGAHVDLIGRMAGGDWVILAAGDDVSLNHRVEEHYRLLAMQADSKIFGISSAFTEMDSCGRLGRTRQARFGCASAYHKNLFTLFPPIGRKVVNEDEVLFVRAKLLGDWVHLGNSLVNYRKHESNVWQGSFSFRSFDIERTLRHSRARRAQFLQHQNDVCTFSKDDSKGKRFHQISRRYWWLAYVLEKRKARKWNRNCFLRDHRLNLTQKFRLLYFSMFPFSLIAFTQRAKLTRFGKLLKIFPDTEMFQ